MNKSVKRIVIAGGGTAGWITAAVLAKAAGKTIDITVVESDAIPTVGVGEATIPTILVLHKILGIDEREFLAKTNATFKLGIAFENWKALENQYLHSFGYAGKDTWACGFQHYWLAAAKRGLAKPYGDYCVEHLAARRGKFAVLPQGELNYAYHLDAGLYAKYLREISEVNGATRVEGKIDSVELDQVTGNISALALAGGKRLEADLFVDCTGFRGLLIEQALHAGYEDLSHYLPCDSAIAMQTTKVDDPVPYTRSIARDAGWQWRIPLQNRTGNGMVFCSQYLSDDEAVSTLVNNVQGDHLTEPRVIKFKTGVRRKHWHKNCVAIGLSSGFLEPLESTSIHLIQKSAIRLAQLLPANLGLGATAAEFNAQAYDDFNFVRDFIILHYKVTNRRDTRFWRHCATMDIPSSLAQKIALFKQTGKIFKHPSELFAEESWMQVMLGQGLMPDSYHPTADGLGGEGLARFLEDIHTKTKQKVDSLPMHQEFIDYYLRDHKLAAV